MSDEVLLQTNDIPISFHMPHVNAMLKSKYSAIDSLKTIKNNDGPMSVILADTAGWDMAYLTRICDLNQAIEENDVTPANFKNSFFDDETSLSGEISGNFNPWRISRGGYGKFLRMIIPIKKGEMAISGKTVALDGYEVLAQIDLESLSEADAPAVIKVISAHQTQNTNTNQVVSSILIHSLESWLNNNQSEFSNVLAMKGLGLISNEEWLKPTSTNCIYVDGKDDSNSFLGLLSMTENRSAAGLSHKMPLLTMPENKKSLLMLGGHRVLEKALLPLLTNKIGNNDSGLLKLSGKDSHISHTEDANIPLEEVNVEGTAYTPQITILDARIENNEVKTSLKINVGIYGNVDVDIHMITYQTLEFAGDPSSSQISFIETKDPEITYSINAAAGVSMKNQDVEHITAVVDAITQRHIKLSCS